MSVLQEFEAVIGLEVHAQLATNSKIFCSCPARVASGVSVSDVPSNANTCPVCVGHPGVLPVLNKKVVEYAIMAGLATNCKVKAKSVFARKNYFYPDLPKGYQISQYDLPICEAGWMDLELCDGQAKRIVIQRIHIEEDAGKNIHCDGYSLVNLNRAGVPLIEIVSAPDMRSVDEAGAYLRALHAIVTYLEICDGNMQEGNFRCDANVSVMPRGSVLFGTRTEIKNVNSFRFVEKAIEYEISRQIGLIKAGGTVIQETRTYDALKNVTVSMRSKEEAHDYRYFPEPDLPPLVIGDEWIKSIAASLPELPEHKKKRFINLFGLSPYDAGVLTASKDLAQFFESAVEIEASRGWAAPASAKPLANFMSGEVARLLNDEGTDISQSKLQPSHLAELAEAVRDGVISATVAKQVLARAWKSGESVQIIIEREGLRQVSDAGSLEGVVEKIIAAHPNQVAEYRAGKEKLIGFFVGQAMKEMGGKANPAMLQELIKRKLGT